VVEDETFRLMTLTLLLYYLHICSSSIHLNALSFAMNVVVGRYRAFNVFQPMDTLFYRFE
jgi:hypothetical protein